MNTLSLTILAATTLLGAALLWSIVADRRRQALQQRLKSLVAARPGGARPDPDAAAESVAGPARSASAWRVGAGLGAGRACGYRQSHRRLAYCRGGAFGRGFDRGLSPLFSAGQS